MEKPKKEHLTEKTKAKISVTDIVSIALLTAACVVGRTVFQFIPNVQPMTAIFIIICLRKDMFRGITVTLLSLLVTNIYMGMGTWTISQFIAYSVVLLVTFLIGKSKTFREHLWMQVVFVFLAGFLYGFAVSCVEAQIYGIRAFLPYYFQGLPFDSFHAAGNAGFYLILSPILTKLMEKYWL